MSSRSATPMETVTAGAGMVFSLSFAAAAPRRRTVAQIRWASANASPALVFTARTRNSSPPVRAARSVARQLRRRLSATSCSARSPWACPRRSLISLRRSRSMQQEGEGRPVAGAAIQLVGEGGQQTAAVGQTGQRVGDRQRLQQILLAPHDPPEDRGERHRRRQQISINQRLAAELVRHAPGAPGDRSAVSDPVDPHLQRQEAQHAARPTAGRRSSGRPAAAGGARG